MGKDNLEVTAHVEIPHGHEAATIVNSMCIESLDPETFKKWEDVCKALYSTRESLKDKPLPLENLR